MRLINPTINFFARRQYLRYLLIFTFAASLFTYLQLDPTFADPDSFYHAKMALILAEKGAITEFPWLSSTTLKYRFSDHHFLYHLILIPFIKIFPPLIGLKVATIFFASLAMVVVFWFLNQLKVKGSFWYTLFLLTANPFIFRLNLAKAQAVVLILLFLTLYFLFNRYYLSLIFASFLYVWLYAGWPLLLVLVITYLIASLIKTKRGEWLIIKRFKRKIIYQNLTSFFAVALGILMGLFFSPYFPKNLYFYWQQSFKIAVINYQYLIGVGGEWYPYKLLELIFSAGPFFLLLIIAFGLFVWSYKRQPLNNWVFLIYTFLFFALTLKSRRNVEYFIPFALCFSALVITNFLNSVEKNLVKLRANKLFVLSPLIILVLLSPIFLRDLNLIKDSFSQGFSFTKFAAPAQWLKEHSPKGSIVFHSDWDEFPLLFYHNSWNYYLVGLDPTFMYEYDKDLYQRWVEITTGKSKEDLYQIMKKFFAADYVFVDINQNAAFDRNLANNFNFQKVFENPEARIYQVIQ